MLLASTRKPLSGSVRLPSGALLEKDKYPSGYWTTIGLAIGIVLGMLLGIVVQTVIGGVSIGVGLGLILGRLLTRRYDKDTRPYTEAQKLERQRRAGWGLIVMVLLVLGTLIAAVLPLLEPAP